MGAGMGVIGANCPTGPPGMARPSIDLGVLLQVFQDAGQVVVGDLMLLLDLCGDHL